MSTEPNRDPLPSHVQENIDKIAQLATQTDERLNHHQRRIEKFTSALGRPRSIYAVVVLVIGWVAWNLVAPHLGIAPFDPPPFQYLETLTTICALIMTAMVLTTQNRQARHAVSRAHLDLQINLLAEQKTSKVIALLEELRRDLPSVRDRTDLVAEALTEVVDPAGMAQEIEKIERTLEDHTRSEK